MMIILRKYKHQDKDSLIKFWQGTFPNQTAHNDPVLVLTEKLKKDNSILIAEKLGQIIGSCMAGYDDHHGWLYCVTVSSKSRRIGIGSKLVKHTIKQLHQQGCTKVNLKIVAGNELPIEFYQALGFSVEGGISMGKFTARYC
jgi:ribosomal protein S18 acetylase RimI-like enzyme